MKQRTLIRLAAVLALTAAAAANGGAQQGPTAPAAAAPEWKVFTPPSGLFTVHLPGTPSHHPKQVDQGFHKATNYIYRIDRASTDGTFYEISHMKLAESDGLPPSMLLDVTVDTKMNLLLKEGGKELGRANAPANGCAGREYTALTAGNEFLQGRVLVVEDQLINAFYVASPPGANHRQMAWRFLNSLAVPKGCAPAEPTPTPSPAAIKSSTVSGRRDPATGWLRITPKQSGFSVLMPGVAAAEEEGAQEKPFPLLLRSYFAEDDTTVYGAVECGDFPPEASQIEHFHEMNINVAFRSLEHEMAALGAKVTLEGSAPFAGHAARQYLLSAPDSGGRALVVSTPRKFYFFFAYSAGPPAKAKLDRFFSSIRLHK